MRNILFFACLVVFVSSCGPKKVTPEIFLIPSDYHGAVKIIFGQACGKQETKENGKRVYIIPENGILISKFKQELGIINQEYYYLDAKGGRTLIPQMNLADFNEATTTTKNPNEPLRNQLGIFGGGTGIMELEGGEKYEFFTFYVGTYTEVRDSFSTMFDGEGGHGYQYEHMFDSLERLQIKACIGSQ